MRSTASSVPSDLPSAALRLVVGLLSVVVVALAVVGALGLVHVWSLDACELKLTSDCGIKGSPHDPAVVGVFGWIAVACALAAAFLGLRWARTGQDFVLPFSVAVTAAMFACLSIGFSLS
jgi:hypothetical protein